MTSRERLLGVLRGQKIDRVPISTYELVGYDTTNFCNIEPSYQSLMDFIREKTDCMAMWEPTSNANLCASAFPPPIQSKTYIQPNGREACRRLTIAGRTLSQTNRWLNGLNTTWNTESWCKDIEDIDAMMSLPYIPIEYDFADFTRISTEIGDHGIVMSSISDPAYIAMELMEFGDAMVWAMTETEHFARVVEMLHTRVMTNLERMLNAGMVDLYRICGPEYMTPPLLPRWCFERFMVPYLKDMVDLIHSKGAKVRLHCHGKIGTLLDLIAKLGFDAMDPCEGPPDGDVEFAELKRRVGDGLTLFGNMQLKLLENGTEAEVRAETRRIVEAGKPGGRFIVMPTAGPINVPLAEQTQANYFAYIDEALSLGGY